MSDEQYPVTVLSADVDEVTYEIGGKTVTYRDPLKRYEGTTVHPPRVVFGEREVAENP